ncbi:hypothetical protein CONLIGDRAFT_685896 [Coniochaeta ligniaria NRRL 30616]|uniref:Uncharacterized protein n=1 Tax=Coniochaeta ligniaria NRRL 30616 TaxID=1408157 RepID=A0A1J7J9R5_9PEZI|nr:hypothetical protein CONLIGDRAFT_685896 [Coniochaeta ligniaria NRRL 30616]
MSKALQFEDFDTVRKASLLHSLPGRVLARAPSTEDTPDPYAHGKLSPTSPFRHPCVEEQFKFYDTTLNSRNSHPIRTDTIDAPQLDLFSLLAETEVSATYNAQDDRVVFLREGDTSNANAVHQKSLTSLPRARQTLQTGSKSREGEGRDSMVKIHKHTPTSRTRSPTLGTCPTRGHTSTQDIVTGESALPVQGRVGSAEDA